jgi:hypothetical protein
MNTDKATDEHGRNTDKKPRMNTDEHGQEATDEHGRNTDKKPRMNTDGTRTRSHG